MKVSFPDFETMCKTVWGEARGEHYDGQVAVAFVILNRARIGGWWGATPGAVCLSPWQFSCWNRADPNRPQLVGADVTTPGMAGVMSAVAAAIVSFDSKADPTHGATHYFVRGIVAPDWSKGKVPVAEIGHHLFFSHVD